MRIVGIKGSITTKPLSIRLTPAKRRGFFLAQIVIKMVAFCS